jgi:hypothetical protein
VRTRGAIIVTVVALTTSATALAAGSVSKHKVGRVRIAAGQTRSVAVPYPDALEYGNARYSGSSRIELLAPGRGEHAAVRAKVTILSAEPVLGGSEYRVRAHNGNVPATAPVVLAVAATTVEPLPHS